MAEVEAEADKAAAEERAAGETAARLARLQAAGLEVRPAGQAQADMGERACQWTARRQSMLLLAQLHHALLHPLALGHAVACAC